MGEAQHERPGNSSVPKAAGFMDLVMAKPEVAHGSSLPVGNTAPVSPIRRHLTPLLRRIVFVGQPGLGKWLPETGNVFPFSCARCLAYERHATPRPPSRQRGARRGCAGRDLRSWRGVAYMMNDRFLTSVISRPSLGVPADGARGWMRIVIRNTRCYRVTLSRRLPMS